ncbi:hypothetical protein HK096_000049, partial [Nowakowskiella sp. JEL0078]
MTILNAMTTCFGCNIQNCHPPQNSNPEGHSTCIEILQFGVEREEIIPTISNRNITNNIKSVSSKLESDAATEVAQQQQQQLQNVTEEETELLREYDNTVKQKIVAGSLDGKPLIKRVVGGIVTKNIPIVNKMKTQGVIGCDFSNLSADNINPLAVALRHNKSRLEYLSILNGETIYMEYQIGTALRNCSHLRYLNLCNNGFDRTGVLALKSALYQYSNLEYLGLSGNNLGDHGVSIINSVVLQNTNLGGIDLSNNNITYSGAKEIANILLHSRNLKMIWLNDNLVDDNCGSELLSALLQNTSLVYLEISSNRLGINLKTRLKEVRK